VKSHQLLAAITFTASAIALAGEVKITLPAETGTLKPGPGIELALASCLTCHSVEYISTQPPMKRAFWEASVKKMREKYGADAPEATLQQLIEYLTATYGLPDKPKP
jgi:sulfite dehydrogenase (cytochrome) subunit B